MVRRGRMRKARTALLWAAVAVALAQVGLLLAFAARSPSRDPEYDLHLAALKQRLKERAPGRPLILLLGSSRVGLNVRPALMAVNRQAGGPVVFNFGLCYSGPVLELLCLRRLLADGVHPDLVLAEVFPLMLTSDEESKVVYRERLRWDDLAALRPYDPVAARRPPWLWMQCLPWRAYRNVLLNQWAPSWLGPDRQTHPTWDDLDGWGWNAYPSAQPRDWADQYARIDGMRQYAAYIPLTNQFRPRPAPMKAQKELADLCHKENIRLCYILSPELFLPDLEPAARVRIDDCVRALGREDDAPVIDARSWMPEDAFCEGLHLTYAGQADYTERLEREVLRPYLDGAPLARGGPATPPLVQCGAGFTFLERVGAVRRRWCGTRGELVLFNPGDHSRRVALRFTARTRASRSAVLDLEGSFFCDRLNVGADGVSFEQVFTLPPGRQVLRLSCDAPAWAGPTGDLVFGLADCTLSDVETSAAALRRGP